MQSFSPVSGKKIKTGTAYKKDLIILYFLRLMAEACRKNLFRIILLVPPNIHQKYNYADDRAPEQTSF